MKQIILLIGLGILAFSSCTPIKRAQTGLARSIAGTETAIVDGHEVYCSEGKVCAEVNVLAISVENKDGGRVQVTLKNQTGNAARLQIRLQIKDRMTGEVFFESFAEDVPLPPTQEKTYEMRGIYRKDALVRVLMNTAK